MRVKMKDKHGRRGIRRLTDELRLGMAFTDNITLTVIESEKRQD